MLVKLFVSNKISHILYNLIKYTVFTICCDTYLISKLYSPALIGERRSIEGGAHFKVSVITYMKSQTL